MLPSLDVRWSRRFEKLYYKSLSLQFMVAGEVALFERRYVEDPANFLMEYERAENTGPRGLIEFDLGGGHRMVGDWAPPTLTLLDFGGKSVVKHARRIEIPNALATARPAPAHLQARTESIFHRAPAKGFAAFGNELHEDWIFGLDTSQYAAVEKIYDSALAVLTDADHRCAVHVILDVSH